MRAIEEQHADIGSPPVELCRRANLVVQCAVSAILDFKYSISKRLVFSLLQPHHITILIHLVVQGKTAGALQGLYFYIRNQCMPLPSSVYLVWHFLRIQHSEILRRF